LITNASHNGDEQNIDEHARDKKSTSLFSYLAIFAVLIPLNTLLVAYGEIPYSNAPGGGGLYTAATFMIAFALWFGGWGVLATYTGCFSAAGMLMGLPAEVNLYWSLADLWQALIPLSGRIQSI